MKEGKQMGEVFAPEEIAILFYLRGRSDTDTFGRVAASLNEITDAVAEISQYIENEEGCQQPGMGSGTAEEA